MQNNEANQKNQDNKKESNSFSHWIIRFIFVAIVLAVTSFLTPGFTIRGLWSFLLAAVVITFLDYLVEKFMGVDASPFGKGFKGFIISAIIIYLTQFLVTNMRVSILGALLAAIVIGIIDAIIPGRVM
ncbi:phage holin family protein [Clostridium fermenticellae]|uniref:Phage holin family protein n=1 Tax=Clostridium fermenticellae TaxID=2068654 RepID=A0A386H264_9CLOT|nr:phage holin family protein [Clostridium fermenticellae]AYD39744.1 phage holin family protein [Clostridium fermenticellae]